VSTLLRSLTVLSVLELLSVAVLLANLVTVHDPAVTRILGPVHGALYLAVVAIAVFGRGLSGRTRVGAVLPVLSGPLTIANIRRESR